MKPLTRKFAPLLLILVLVACSTPAPQPTATPTVAPAAEAPTRVPPTPGAALQPTRAPTATAAPTVEPSATPVPRDPLFDPARLSYAHNFTTPQIQAFLEERGSGLARVRFQVGDRSHSFAETLVGLTSLYSVNPRLMLALLELHAGLVSAPAPSAEQLAWAMGYRGDGGGRRGLYSQVRWAARELRWATRDYSLRGDQPPPAISFADGARQEYGADVALNRYVLARVLGPTTNAPGLGPRMDALINTYARLFEDPRLAPEWPPLAEPFLTRPMDRPFPVTSFFDHDAPFLVQNGSLRTFWGRSETDSSIAYDGHTGWDFAMAPPDRILAAAPGTIIFAGNSDDGCASPARAVILEHGNGYRTLYWHLSRVDVELGQFVERGAPLGIAGSTGCSTGPHLHFQVQYLGRDVDPFGWCGSDPDPWAARPAGQQSVWLWSDMPSPCGPPPPGVIVVDDADPGFVAIGVWLENEVGYAGGSRFAATSFAGSTAQPWRLADIATPPIAAWRPELPAAGRYRVLAYIPFALNGLDESREMRYLIRHAEGESTARVNAEDLRNWWADLGEYTFDPTADPMVLTSGLAGDRRRGIWVDAVAFVPIP
jgi:murein DD-endopeptidase MepM/ murein hydrolase activator NlpD